MKSNRATIKDVAEKAGVGISVVSYVLNDTPGKSIPESTRERVWNAARELDYTPNAIARGMRLKKSMAIGLVCFWEITDHVFIEVLKGVSGVCDKNSYNIVFCSIRSSSLEFSYIDLFRRQQIDGVVFVSPHQGIRDFNEQAHVEALRKNKVPAVIINGYTQDPSMSYIHIDYYSTAYTAAEYLIRLGHRELGYMHPKAEEENYIQAIERWRGFQDALQDHGLLVDKSFIFGPQDMNRVICSIQEGSGPSAIVANKSNYGHVLLKLLYESGVRVPEQVSVIAANTEPYSEYLFPPMTTIRLPFDEMGEKGAQILMDSIAQKVSQVNLKLPCKINELASCRKQ